MAMSSTWTEARVLNQKVEVKTGRWRGDPTETELTASAGVIGPGRQVCRVDLTGPSHGIIKLAMPRAYMIPVREMFPSHRPCTGH